MRSLPRRWRIVLGSIFFLFALAGAVYAFAIPHHGRTVVVTLTADGFSPDTVYIDKGDTVEFRSTVGQPYWPASNYHPTHTLYPEFDPKHPIPPGETWSFTFDRPGVWGFHDHLAPSFEGTVVVRGTLGQSTEACLATKGGGSALAPECWEADIKYLMDTKGFDATFSYIDEQQRTNPAFNRNCHDVMHIVGVIAYQDFKGSQAITSKPETAMCGYGFYHGFLEAMQKAEGRGNMDAARNYCTQVGTVVGKQAEDPCIHGIGHATFDSIGGTLWGKPQAMIDDALGVCERTFSTANDQHQCATGVYNSFANAVIAKNYYLSFDLFDVKTLCNAQKPQYVEACYAEVGNAYLRNHKYDRAQSIAYIRSFPAAVIPNQYYVYFADEAKQHMAQFDAQQFANGCMALHPDERQSCVYGVVEGIREESNPSEAYKYQFPFCHALSDQSLADICVKRSVTSSPKTGAGFHAACLAEPAITEKGLCGTGS